MSRWAVMVMVTSQHFDGLSFVSVGWVALVLWFNLCIRFWLETDDVSLRLVVLQVWLWTFFVWLVFYLGRSIDAS